MVAPPFHALLFGSLRAMKERFATHSANSPCRATAPLCCSSLLVTYRGHHQRLAMRFSMLAAISFELVLFALVWRLSFTLLTFNGACSSSLAMKSKLATDHDNKPPQSLAYLDRNSSNTNCLEHYFWKVREHCSRKGWTRSLWKLCGSRPVSRVWSFEKNKEATESSESQASPQQRGRY